MIEEKSGFFVPRLRTPQSAEIPASKKKSPKIRGRPKENEDLMIKKENRKRRTNMSPQQKIIAYGKKVIV